MDHIVAVVIPCYRVRDHLADVLRSIGTGCDRIYVVDDACPDKSYEAALTVNDPRVAVMQRAENGGVGAASLDGMVRAARDGATVILKLDGDGQMDGADIPRLVGNIALSFAAKASTGYWDLFDPTNGFFAIEARVFRLLPTDRISRRYFFENDLLYRLGTLRAKIVEVPVAPKYGAETSDLDPMAQILPFLFGHLRNTAKRTVYGYFLRNFGPASVLLVAGLLLNLFGVTFGAAEWWQAAADERFASAGTVMLAALPVIIGVQCILGFLIIDTLSMPRKPFISTYDSPAWSFPGVCRRSPSDPGRRMPNADLERHYFLAGLRGLRYRVRCADRSRL